MHRRLLAGFAVLLASVVPSWCQQEWNAAQQEVWKSVETYWALDAAGNTEGFLSYFHADYSGWGYANPLPNSKEVGRKFITHSHQSEKTLVQNIQPVAIKVYGNVAFVHYHYRRISRDTEGKQQDERGRWTDILTKQGDRWVMIGDHGGPAPSASAE